MSGPINRTISVGLNVEDAAQLPKLGDQLARFLRKLDAEHGPFDVVIGIAVSGYKPASTFVTNYYNEEEAE